MLGELSEDDKALLPDDANETLRQLVKTQQDLIDTQKKLQEMMERDVKRMGEGE